MHIIYHALSLGLRQLFSWVRLDCGLPCFWDHVYVFFFFFWCLNNLVHCNILIPLKDVYETKLFIFLRVRFFFITFFLIFSLRKFCEGAIGLLTSPDPIHLIPTIFYFPPLLLLLLATLTCSLYLFLTLSLSVPLARQHVFHLDFSSWPVYSFLFCFFS